MKPLWGKRMPQLYLLVHGSSSISMEGFTVRGLAVSAVEWRLSATYSFTYGRKDACAYTIRRLRKLRSDLLSRSICQKLLIRFRMVVLRVTCGQRLTVRYCYQRWYLSRLETRTKESNMCASV